MNKSLFISKANMFKDVGDVLFFLCIYGECQTLARVPLLRATAFRMNIYQPLCTSRCCLPSTFGHRTLLNLFSFYICYNLSVFFSSSLFLFLINSIFVKQTNPWEVTFPFWILISRRSGWVSAVIWFGCAEFSIESISSIMRVAWGAGRNETKKKNHLRGYTSSKI